MHAFDMHAMSNESLLLGCHIQHQFHPDTGHQCLVKLLLSIDRRESTEQALETVQLAASLQDQGVVGIDLSGNPAVGTWQTWLPALNKAREQGLKITLHAAEVGGISNAVPAC